MNVNNNKRIPALHLSLVFGEIKENLYVERYDDKEFYRVETIVHDVENNGMLFLDENDFPILELFDVDEDDYVSVLNVATHATELNAYFNPDQFDSCVDRWFFIEL